MNPLPVAREREIPPGTSRLVTWEGKEVALFNVEGRLYALGNRCPHRSGPLVQGRIEKIAEPSRVAGLHPEKAASASGLCVVRCPLHGWLFDLATGQCLTRPGASTPSYFILAQDGEITLQSP